LFQTVRMLLKHFPTRRSSDLYDISGTRSLKNSLKGRMVSSKISAFLLLNSASTKLRVIILAKYTEITKSVVTNSENANNNPRFLDRKSTRLNSSHVKISYAVF